MAQRLGDSMFSRYLRFGRAWHDRTGVGQMTTLLDQRHDVVAIFGAALRMASSGLLLAGYFGVMLLISWKLTLTALLVLPVMYVGSRTILKRTGAAARRIKEAMLEIGRHTHETLAMIPVFQGAGREDEAVQIFSEQGEVLRRNSLKSWQLHGASARIQELTALLSLLLMLGLAFRLEPERAAQPAIFLVFFFIARVALPILSALPESLLDISERLPRCRAVLSVFAHDGKFVVTGGVREFSGLRDAIRFEGVTFAYPDGPSVLDQVSFEARSARMTALVGPTGAGKSTVFHLLMRFYDIDPGMIFLDGIDIREFSIQSLRRQIALVSQETMVLSGTLRANLLFGVERFVPPAELDRAIEDARLDELVAALPGGLDGVIGERGGTLSGGQRQRVAIARALLRRTPVILLDEATSGLDAITEGLVREAIVNAARRSTTVLVIAHRFATIQQTDHVVVLDGGRVCEQGEIGELTTREGMFRRLLERQQVA
jgi:subfamily B ATP-binding cassette protein MsbA